MPYENCTVAREGRVTIVTLNRPEVLNALNAHSHEELHAVFDAFAADPEQWVAIVTGAGERAFCAGQDLKEQAAGAALRWPSSGFGGLTARLDLNKPVLAAVNGIAMGGGFELAMASDIVVAAENAIFALPEPRVGLAALAGGLIRLPRQIGLKPAMGIILTGRRVSATEGLALGFVNQVVSQQNLLTAARQWAAEILACSPMSIRASKEAVRRGLDETSLGAALSAQHHYPAVRQLYASVDFHEGPRAFSENRTPKWHGR